MRFLASTWAALLLFVWCGVIAAAGCENTAGNCELTAECTGAPGMMTGGGCDPNKSDTAVPDSCGIFISASAAPGGNGTAEKPYTTFAEGFGAAEMTGTRRVYVCSETFAENVVVPADFTVYGGLDCKNGWKLDAASRTTIEPPSKVPLQFAAGSLTHAENLLAQAADGLPPDPSSMNPRSGGSSIAVIAASGSNVELLRCDFIAGSGGNGTDGPPISGTVEKATDGKPGDDACGASGNGGDGAAFKCGAQQTDGGRGGNGGDGASPDGKDGATEGGTGGTGQKGVNPCLDGGAGKAGDTGQPGKGGAPLPSLIDADGKGSPGSDGAIGLPGSGGGGGGGGKVCAMADPNIGAGGGGGGAGGCPGAGGKGGGAGGSSIALWAAGAMVSLTQSTLTAKSGGKGGNGSAGQAGGKGGMGAPGGVPTPESTACAGGAGGDGGPGGPGGGGAGGHSIAAVWSGVKPSKVTTPPAVAPKASGGAGGGAAPPETAKGADGLSCNGFNLVSGQCEEF